MALVKVAGRNWYFDNPTLFLNIPPDSPERMGGRGEGGITAVAHPGCGDAARGWLSFCHATDS
jgi:hypothetical protein